MRRDNFTDTVDAAAAYERLRALSETDFDEPERPDPSDWREWESDEAVRRRG